MMAKMSMYNEMSNCPNF